MIVTEMDDVIINIYYDIFLNTRRILVCPICA